MKKGSIIKRRTHAYAWHMGVYLGGYKVAHFKKKEGNPRFRIDSLSGFSKGKNVIVHLEPENTKHAEETCKRAMEMTKSDRGYSLVFWNCEDAAAKAHGKYNKISQRKKALVAAGAATATFVFAKRKRRGNV